MRFWICALVCSGLLLSVGKAAAHGDNALRLMSGIAVGSVEDSGYGATAVFNGGWEFDEVFSLELQGGIGITEEAGLGTERFFHLELLLPATMTICSSETWICPGSTFELVVIAGVGGARFTGRWSPNVVAGLALDSFGSFPTFEVGLRAGVLGSYDVLDFESLVVMMHLHLGVIFRFGGR